MMIKCVLLFAADAATARDSVTAWWLRAALCQHGGGGGLPVPRNLTSRQPESPSRPGHVQVSTVTVTGSQWPAGCGPPPPGPRPACQCHVSLTQPGPELGGMAAADGRARTAGRAPGRYFRLTGKF